MNNIKIIIINGKAKSGKDTFVSMCKKYLGWVFNYSTVDFIKEFLMKSGWDGEKTEKSRQVICEIKKICTLLDDIPLKILMTSIENFKEQIKVAEHNNSDQFDSIIFIHCREPEEIKKIVEKTGALTLLILRDEVDKEKQPTEADEHTNEYDYDYKIYNNGTIEELEKKAKNFLEMIGVNVQ